VADGDALKPYLAERYERLTGGPDARERSFAIRRVLWKEVGMTLEQARALRWDKYEALVEGLVEAVGTDSDGTQLDLANTEGLTSAGFNVREFGG
jgi:hypothetical protein